MTPVASLVITAEVGEVLGKGEEMGYFKFLGSDFVTAIERDSQIEMPTGPTNISFRDRRWPEATDRYEVVNRLIWLISLVDDETCIGRSPSHSENHSDVVFQPVVRHATGALSPANTGPSTHCLALM